MNIPTIANDLQDLTTDRADWGDLTSRVLELAPLYVTGERTLGQIALATDSNTGGVSKILHQHNYTKQRAVMTHAHRWTQSVPRPLWWIADQVKGVSANYVKQVFKKYGVIRASNEPTVKRSKNRANRIRAFITHYNRGFVNLADIAALTGASVKHVSNEMNKLKPTRKKWLFQRVDVLLEQGWELDRALSACNATFSKYKDNYTQHRNKK